MLVMRVDVNRFINYIFDKTGITFFDRIIQ